MVQHMPEGFTDMFARRLDEVCPLRVKEAQSGDVLQPGRVLICPGSRHMKVKRLPLGDVVVLGDEPRVNGHRPSADVLLRSVAEEFRTQAVGVLMTGMGDDGAEGLGAVKKEGGMTIAQSEESCVVYGMPKAAIERGYAIRVVGLEGMGAALQAICGRNAGSGNGIHRSGSARRKLEVEDSAGVLVTSVIWLDKPGMICSRKGRCVWSSLHQ